MVEIYLLIKWGRQLGDMCRQANLPAWKYQFLMVIFWFGGEFIGSCSLLLLSVIFDETIALILAYVLAFFVATRSVRYPFYWVEQQMKSHAVADGQWICGRCGEAVASEHSACLMCGAERYLLNLNEDEIESR